MTAKMKVAGLSLGLLSLVPWQMAVGCGHCIEDKVAATYDYHVFVQAQRKGDGIAYAEITGPAVTEPGISTIVQKIVSGTAGVANDSVRLSPMPPAVSFAWDLAHYELAPILDAVNKELKPHRLHVSLLRRWDTKEGMK